MKNILKHEYPNLKNADYKKALSFIDGKYSQYYFLDYMRCSNGNVDDAIKFAMFDDQLRAFLLKYLIRFEIQLKTDFVNSVYEKTRCTSFWEKKKYYLPDTRISHKKGKTSKYYLLKKKIKFDISKLHCNTIGPSHHVAMYACTFGTFQELFKCMDREYKNDFIKKYTQNFEGVGYKLLNTYFEVIRKIRNRCAHGAHLITKKIFREFKNLNFGINEENKNSKIAIEKTFNFIFDNLYCGIECKKELFKLIFKYNDLLVKYSKNHSIPVPFLKPIDD